MRRITTALLMIGPLLASCGGEIDIDTVEFRRIAVEESAPDERTQAPGISIDTNITRPGLLTTKYRSSNPYGIHFDHTDPTRTFESLVITSVRITYADGQVEPAVEDLRLPRSWRFRSYEAVNSTSNGIVRKKLEVVSGDLKGVIARDEDFRLEVRGHFTREGAEALQFEIDRGYEMFRDQRTRSRGDFFSDV